MPHRSRVSAKIIDTPEEQIELSIRFWIVALGRPTLAKSDPDAPFNGLETPPGMEPDIYVQAIGAAESRLHLDIETDYVEAEVRRLEILGARRQRHVQDYLWIMEAPSGHVFWALPQN